MILPLPASSSTRAATTAAIPNSKTPNKPPKTGNKGSPMQLRSSLRLVVAIVFCLSFSLAVAPAGNLPEAKPVPKLQVIPLPYDQASFQRDGVEIARYHFGPALERPFLYPIIAPSGRSLTRMGHPRDPRGHSHHNSVWVTHHDVNGHNFWADRTGATIRHRRIVKYADEGKTSSIVAENEWTTKEGKVLLTETRTTTVTLLPHEEWLLVIDLELSANDKPVTLGKTPFGMIGVRMAKTIGVHDGGGRIRNSEGAVNEKGVFWKRARWVDYSGPIAPGITEGITLFDHPDNSNHPSHFHVRNDGWMGASLTFDAARVIEPNAPLKLRYGLYVHDQMKPPAAIESQYQTFTTYPSPQ
jgi:hypothetical protein